MFNVTSNSVMSIREVGEGRSDRGDREEDC